MKIALWTIQPASLLGVLESRSELYVSEQLMRRGEAPSSYRWLASELSKRYSGFFTGQFTWWAYVVMPDLRKLRFLMSKGSYVRIKLREDEESCVVFPVWAWNTVYGGAYLCKTEAEKLDWERRLNRAVKGWEDLTVLPAPWQQELQQSWATLFDWDLPEEVSWDEMFPHSSAKVAVFEKLNSKNIVGLDYFEGKGPGIPISENSERHRQ